MNPKLKNLRCPHCRKPVDWNSSEHRPFCSEKCRLIDLGQWAESDYRIAGDPVPPADSEF